MCAKGIRFTKEEAVGKTDSSLVLTAEGSLQGVKERKSSRDCVWSPSRSWNVKGKSEKVERKV